MQPRCRRCRRTGMLCVYGLIAVFILQLVRDIRRKWHLSQLIQDFFKNPLIFESDQTVSFFYHPDHFRFQKPVSKNQTCSRFHLSSRLHQCFPDIILFPFQKKYFHLCTGSFLLSDQTRRNNLCIIDHKAVSRVQVVYDFTENMVLRLTGFLIQNQKP